MEIKHNISLKALNSFSVNVNAEHLLELSNSDQLDDLLKEVALVDKTLVLGAGSNILFVNDVSELIILNQLKGMTEVDEDKNFIWVDVASGENWHDFVLWSLSEGYSGLENLSLIPGSVGAAPVQNIGAYGVQLSDTFVCLQALDLETGQNVTMDKNDCQYQYRDSVFKSAFPGRYLITSVTFKLNKQFKPQLNYKGVSEQLELMGFDQNETSALQMSEAICALRRSKLPDPDFIGNAGSFFKNPTIDAGQYFKLKAAYPSLAGFLEPGACYKVSAAWLIDQCGFKGVRHGDAGVSEKHALVLVNHGNASGEQILQLATEIQTKVENKFKIKLDTEPTILM